MIDRAMGGAEVLFDFAQELALWCGSSSHISFNESPQSHTQWRDDLGTSFRLIGSRLLLGTHFFHGAEEASVAWRTSSRLTRRWK
jgi:hypothetical protein